MNDPLFVNGRFTTTAERVIGVEDRGFQFGDAVYEVMKFIGKRVIFAADHYRRMSNGLGFLRIANPWPASEDFADVCRELLARTAVTEGILYVQVSRGECERVHFYPEGLTPTAVAYTRAWNFPDETKKRKGIAIVTGPDLRWDRCSVKSVNLLGNVLAKDAARRGGAEECVLIRDGVVTEGASASFFGVSDGTLVTHPADEGILPGTVRDHVLVLARSAALTVDERPLRVEEIPALDEAFITSTAQGVMPVTTIDGVALRGGDRGVLTERLQRLYGELERREAEGE